MVFKLLSFLQIKDSSLDLGIKDTVIGSKYTGSAPSTAFLSFFVKDSTSVLGTFLFWLVA